MLERSWCHVADTVRGRGTGGHFYVLLVQPLMPIRSSGNPVFFAVLSFCAVQFVLQWALTAMQMFSTLRQRNLHFHSFLERQTANRASENE